MHGQIRGQTRVVQYNFFDLSGVGTNLGLTRDDTTSYPRALPWQFPFYGRTFENYSICTNGFLSFWSAARNYLNDPMTLQRDPYYMIAAYWTDLNPTAGGQVLEYYDQANDRFMVQWNEIPLWGGGPGENLTFQVILYPDGAVDLVYEHMRDVALLHTVGIKGGKSTEFMQFSHNGTLIDSLMTLRITRPDTSDASLRILSGKQGVVPPQGEQEVRLRLSNNSVVQGLSQFPLVITSSDPDGSDVQITCAMQGGTPFEPQTVVSWQAGTLRLNWKSHPTDNYAIWTALPNDTLFVPLVASVTDTVYALPLPAVDVRIYAVTLAGAPAPQMANDTPAISRKTISAHRLSE